MHTHVHSNIEGGKPTGTRLQMENEGKLGNLRVGEMVFPTEEPFPLLVQL